MSKALSLFPKKSLASFDPDRYGFDVRQQVAKPSEYTGDVGIEIELEGRGLPNAIPFTLNGVEWVAKADGSLRGGIEYVTSKPCAAADVRPLVDGLFEAITAAGGRVNNSTRCSTHVHVNATGMKLNQICAFVALYGSFETTLTNWCEPIRRGNLFALRLEDCDYAVEQWARCFKSGDFEWSNEHRYLALNPASMARFGSLEVRTLGAVTSADPVVKWVDALLRLRTLAKSEAYADPSRIAEEISGLGGRGFFDQVFEGLEITPELVAATDVHDLENDVRAGFRRIQPVVYSVSWQHVLPEIAKVWIPNPFASPMKRKKGPQIGRMEMPMPPLRFEDNPEPDFDEEDEE